MAESHLSIQLEKAAQGDLKTLADLDARGFLCGLHETAEEYAARLKCLLKNAADLEKALADTGRYEKEGMAFQAQDRIPPSFYRQVDGLCQRLYAFSIDWVPGFFLDPSFSFLFGGCAYYYLPDFFALFIIRRSFKRQERWLIYNRKELLAHELCHVARIALNSNRFEEDFAYRTASSPLRRFIGGIFHHERDSFLFLGSVFLMLAAQILRTFWLPQLPIWPFWSGIGAVVAWLVLRHLNQASCSRRALLKLRPCFGDRAEAVLFRCGDDEIPRIAAMATPQECETWCRQQATTVLRWKVILHRFLSN